MKKVKVKIIGSGKDEDPFTVDLPTWSMIGEIDHNKKQVFVGIPDDEVDLNGKIDQDKIRSKYKKNWSNFNAATVEAPG